MLRLTRLLSAGLLICAAEARADPAFECSIDSPSQVEVADCLAEVEATVNAVLASVLNMTLQAAQSLDEATERDVAVPALSAGQQAWESYRDAHCAYVGAGFGGGSGTGAAILSCRIEVTRARIADLVADLR